MRLNTAKLVGSLILALLLVIFSSQNLHPVWIRFVTGPPVQLPLIVVVAGALIVGYAIATFNHIRRTMRQKEKKEELDE